MRSTVSLILGGARSGKSWFAEKLAARSGESVLYIATATAGDAEMAERIAAHRAARPATWRTIEAPDALAEAVRANAAPGDVVVVDCLTLWVSNVILGRIGDAEVETLVAAQWDAIEAELSAAAVDLLATARERDVALILVSNEVGLGVVPPYPLGRRYRDALGRVNQTMARQADSVVLMVAGLPVDLRRFVAVEYL